MAKPRKTISPMTTPTIIQIPKGFGSFDDVGLVAVSLNQFVDKSSQSVSLCASARANIAIIHESTLINMNATKEKVSSSLR